MFKLERPLVSLDLETTGLKPATDRIMEIAIIVMYPDGRVTEWSSLVNPGVPIPAEISKATVNDERPDGITDALVADAPRFEALAENIAHGTRNVDFLGFNVRSFDLPFLHNELARAGFQTDILSAKVVDVMKIYHDLKRRTLTDAVKDYLGESHASAHGALPDARNTLRVALAMLEKHDLPRTPAELHQAYFGNKGDKIAGGKFVWINDVACIGFGKHEKKPLKDVPRHYLEWMIRGDFPLEVLFIVGEALDGRYPTRNSGD